MPNYSSFSSVKWLGRFLQPLDICQNPFIHLGWERHCESKFSVFAKNTVQFDLGYGGLEPHTAQYGIQLTNQGGV